MLHNSRNGEKDVATGDNVVEAASEAPPSNALHCLCNRHCIHWFPLLIVLKYSVSICYRGLNTATSGNLVISSKTLSRPKRSVLDCYAT